MSIERLTIFLDVKQFSESNIKSRGTVIANFIRHEGCSDLHKSLLIHLQGQNFEICIFEDQLPLPDSPIIAKLEAVEIALHWYLEQAKSSAYFAATSKKKVRNLIILLGTPFGLLLTILRILIGQKAQDFNIASRVTRKHFDAIKSSLARYPNSPIAVFEADALLEVGGQFMKICRLQRLNNLYYLNLAGGYDPTLNGASISECGVDGVKQITPPQSATSCAYILSPEYGLELVEMCIARPKSLLLGIDHLHNKVLRQTSGRAFIASPPLIVHGSTTGLSKSWRG